MIRWLPVALATLIPAAAPAAAAPSRLLHAELRDGGRVVWQSELVITTIPDIQMVAVQVDIPNPRTDDATTEGAWHLFVAPADAHAPLPERPPRGLEEFQFSFSWRLPLDAVTQGRDGETRPAVRSRRDMSYEAAFRFGRHGRQSFALLDGLVLTFWR